LRADPQKDSQKRLNSGTLRQGSENSDKRKGLRKRKRKTQQVRRPPSKGNGRRQYSARLENIIRKHPSKHTKERERICKGKRGLGRGKIIGGGGKKGFTGSEFAEGIRVPGRAVCLMGGGSEGGVGCAWRGVWGGGKGG